MPNGEPSRPIEEVLADHGESLRRLPGVIGTAIGVHQGVPCIRLLVTAAALARQAFPRRLEGYVVRVEASDPIEPRSDESQ